MNYKIGELSALSAVPVKTIRYYSDIGILPPTEFRGRLRLYSEMDRARLGLIRSLREIGVDLATIQRLLDSQTTVRDTLALQLDAVNAGIRALQRRGAILRAALGRGAPDTIEYLERLRKLSELDALERRKLVEDYLDRAFDGIPVNERWKQDFRRHVVFDVPDDLGDAQLDAWLELADLLTDESFIERMRVIGRDSWGDGKRSTSYEESRPVQRAIEAEALRLADRGEPATSPAARAIAGRFLDEEARRAGQAVDPRFALEVIDRIDRNSDPRATRFWQLVATLKGWKNPDALPTERAYRWLFSAVRAWE